METRWDAIVVGGGPAGSVAAIALGRRGVRVALCEAKRYPRDKICGDALIPDSLSLLRDMGLLERVAAEAHRPSAVRILSPDGSGVALSAPLMTLRRIRFDEILVDMARQAGAHVLEGHRIRAPIRDEAGSVVGVCGQTDDGREIELRAPLTVLATGAASQMLAAFGAQLRSQPSAVAMRAYYEAPNLDPGELVISYEKPVMPGYGWVFPMGNGEANVGVGLFLTHGETGENLRDLFERFIESCPHVREAMRGSRPLGPPRGAPLRCGLSGSDHFGPGLLLAGETIGTTYALSGEGIGKAMESGSLAARTAAEALDRGSFDIETLRSYARALERADYPAKFASYDRAQRWLKYERVVDFVTARAAKSERVRDLLEAMVREQVAPDRVFSLRGLLRAAIG